MATDTQQVTPSFIPHTSGNESRPRKRQRSGGVLGIGALVLFLISVGLAAGSFFYIRYLEASLESKKTALAEKEASLDRDTAEELIRFSRRLELSKTLLGQHVAMTPFFRKLEESTLPSIRYTSFNLTYAGGVPHVELQGEARNYEAIALQSDTFGDSSSFKNPVFSDLAPTESGTVGFSLSLEVDPAVLSFSQNL